MIGRLLCWLELHDWFNYDENHTKYAHDVRLVCLRCKKRHRVTWCGR